MVISLISPSVQNSTRTSISGASVGASAACVSGVRRLCAAKTALIRPMEAAMATAMSRMAQQSLAAFFCMIFASFDKMPPV